MTIRLVNLRGVRRSERWYFFDRKLRTVVN